MLYCLVDYYGTSLGGAWRHAGVSLHSSLRGCSPFRRTLSRSARVGQRVDESLATTPPSLAQKLPCNAGRVALGSFQSMGPPC